MTQLLEDFRNPPQSADLAAVGGSAGRAVEAMLQNAIAHGSDVLAKISKAALTRLLAGHPVSYQIAPQNLFTEAEQRELAEAFAAVGATSHLLGRALIRDWAKRVEDKHGSLVVPNLDVDGRLGFGMRHINDTGRKGQAQESLIAAPHAERPPLKLHAYADWEADRAIVVGRIEGSVQPDDTPDPNELPDPFENPLADSPPGVPFKDIDPKRYDGAIRQLEYLCEVLEREGVQVYRPPVLPMLVAQADPVGLCASYVREVFAVIGTRVFLGMCQSPWRNKDADAVEPFLQVLNGGPVPRPGKGEWLEFGDVFRLGKDVMVCCSGQASGLAGAGWLQRQLGDEFKVWPVPIAPEWLHGDYVFSVVKEGLGLAHLPAFPNGFPAPLKDWEMIPVTREEVQGFGANVISLASDKMIFGQGEDRLAKELNKRGIEAIEVPFDDVEFWDGGLDCSTAELWIEG